MTDAGSVGRVTTDETIVTARRRIRLIGCVVAAGLHAALLLALRVEPPAVNLLAPIEIEIVPRGEAVADRQPSEAALASTVPTQETPPPPSEAPPEPPDPVVPPPPIAVAPPMPETAAPSDIQTAASPAETPSEPPVRRERPRQKRPVKPHAPAEARRAPSSKVAPDMAASAETRPMGAVEGREDLRAARASYGALVSAEINRHKHYPAASRERGETGTVAMAFVVGPSGSIVSHAMRRSSGAPALDTAAIAMLEAARAPPPPGGVFRGSIDINFAIGR